MYLSTSPLLNSDTPLSLYTVTPSGPDGVIATLKCMRKIVREYRRNPAIRQKAVELTRGIKQKDWAAEVATLFDFVQNRIRYVKDIRQVETMHTPDLILKNQAGDCDDKCILLAALLESIGHPTMFVACGKKPGGYSHVFAKTKIGANWISLDATEPRPMGWTPPWPYTIKIYN